MYAAARKITGLLPDYSSFGRTFECNPCAATTNLDRVPAVLEFAFWDIIALDDIFPRLRPLRNSALLFTFLLLLRYSGIEQGKPAEGGPCVIFRRTWFFRTCYILATGLGLGHSIHVPGVEVGSWKSKMKYLVRYIGRGTNNRDSLHSRTALHKTHTAGKTQTRHDL